MMGVTPKNPDPLCPRCGYHGPMGVFKLPSCAMAQSGQTRQWFIHFAPFEAEPRKLAKPMTADEIEAEYRRLEAEAAAKAAEPRVRKPREQA